MANLNSRCRYNNGVLIQSMRNTQRRLNKIWQNITTDATQRWQTLAEVFAVSFEF